MRARAAVTITLAFLLLACDRGTAGEWADSVFATLSLEEKVGQIIFPELRLSHADAWTKAESLTRTYGVGGFVLFGGKFPGIERDLEKLQTLSEVPLLITSDLERGAGQQIAGMMEFPPIMALGAARDTLLAYQMGLLTARGARTAGIGLTFSPVLDINTNPGNPIINVRSFGEDPSLVTMLGRSFIKGCADGGLLATAKHFPGHGDTKVDSHSGLPVIGKSRKELEAAELVPFKDAIRHGVDAIMVGHLAVPSLDGTGAPASISRPVIEEFLRGELGFEGLVITDALTMDGVKNWKKGCIPCLLAHEAGADILLMPEDVTACRDSLLAAFSRGKLEEKSLDASVMRILLAKEKVAAADAGKAEKAGARGAPPTQIAARSLTLLKNDQHLVPLGRVRGRVVALVFGSTHAADSLPLFDTLMRQRLGGAYEHLSLNEKSDASLRQAAKEKAKAADILLLMVTTRVAAYTGYPDISPELRALLTEIADPSKTILISLGNPYVIADLPEMPSLLLLYGTDRASQQAIFMALDGTLHIRGKLPVTIPERFAAGFGLELEARRRQQ
jgi:beta-glucosidase-like glycosyl hydrolase